MRTPVIIIAIMVLIVGSAFVIRFVMDKKPLDEKITLSKSDSSKGEKDDKKSKKKNKKGEDNSDESDVTIVQQWDVPEVLKEISAHEYIDAQRFACVQDELGKIFIYNVETEKIEKEIPFGPAGDYEGLALNGETAYVLRADGQIFEISKYNSGKPATKQYNTHLTEKHDTEGMAYDQANDRLLISIKGEEQGTDAYKGIYSFDLKSKKMENEPVLKIDLENDVFAASKSGKKKKDSAMNPSDIAVHPVSGDIYVTDGSKSKLLIMDKIGTIRSLLQLGDSAFSQPEGMSFSPDGKLYISNEGTKGSGNILEVKIP